MTIAYAPFNASYGQTSAYLTTVEYDNAPTAMDTSNLLPGGTGPAQTIALQETIGRASSMVDTYCLGAYGTLTATLNTENARIWGNNSGQLIVHPLFWPIMEVRTFTYGATVGTSASVVPAGNIWIEPTQFIVSPGGVVGLGLNSLAGIAPRQQYLCQWTYVNGWVNSALSASVASGASAISPTSVLGIYPGSSLTLYDVPNDETITVASTYVPGDASVPLVSPLANNHTTTAVVSNLPKVVKQAAILLTTALIKERGSGALIVSDIGEVSHAAHIPQGGDEDMALAFSMLDALRQMFVAY